MPKRPSSARLTARRSSSSLPRDMVVDRRLGDARRLGEVLHGRAVVAALVEHLDGDGEQRLGGVRVALGRGHVRDPPLRVVHRFGGPPCPDRSFGYSNSVRPSLPSSTRSWSVMAAELTPQLLSEKHRPTLDQALEAIRTRAYWSPHPEHPKAYGEARQPERGRGQGRLRRRCCGTRLDLGQPGTDGWAGGELSPYGIELGVEYPHAGPRRAAARHARGHAPPGGTRAPRPAPLVCLEILAADQRPDARVRARGHAHQRPGLHDGVPGGRPARAGPRPGGGGVRVRRAGPHPATPRSGPSRRASATRSTLQQARSPPVAARHRAW